MPHLTLVTTTIDLPGWPPGVMIPPRLVQLLSFLQQSDVPSRFGEFEIVDFADDTLCRLNGGDDIEIFREFPPVLGFFGREAGGGVLALWLRSDDPSMCPVVWFTSEGQIYVVGDDLDDFLCLLAGRWRDDRYSALVGAEVIRAWVREVGLSPHMSCEGRLEPLNRRNLEFLRWFAEQQREILVRLRPAESPVIDVFPGEQVGPVRLGASEEEVSHLLGPPTFASWEKASDPKITAWYKGTPYSVTYRRASRILTQVRVYANREIVRLPDGFQPLLATEEEAMRWLASVDPAYTVNFKILRSRSLGISLSLRWGYGRRHIDTRMSWVDGISIALGDDEARDRF